MQSRLVSSVALFLLLAAPGSAPAEEKDPCVKEWQGQRLVDNLYNVDLMAKLLAHLKGCEDPKLKRLLEINLQWAAAGAREAIDKGAGLASPYVAVNFIRPVRDAMLYASEHQLEKVPSAPGQEVQPENWAESQGDCGVAPEEPVSTLPNPRLQRTGLRLPLSRKPLAAREPRTSGT
jgi:hypothetical protein